MATKTLPPKLLSCYMQTNSVDSIWDSTAGSSAGQARSWLVTLIVTPQAHSNTVASVSGFYDATDIVVGDYITTGTGALVYKIIQIVDVINSNRIQVIVEDEDRLNGVSDPNQFSSGQMYDGLGVVFSLKNGYPALFPLPVPLPAALTSDFASQLQSRFMVRGKHDTYSVAQPGHQFQAGQAVALKSNGSFSALDFTVASQYNQLFGIVEEVGYPSYDWIRIRTVGPVIDVELTNGSTGDVFYIDPTSSNGSLLYGAPGSIDRRQPVYIKIDNTKALFLASGMLTHNIATGQSGGGGSFVVENMSELATLTDVFDGTTALVKEVGNPEGPGEWGYFIYNTSTGWTQLSTFDSSTGDSKSVKITVTHANNGTNFIQRVSHNVRIVNAGIKVIQPFNGIATITIGDSTRNDKFLSIDEADLSTEGTYYSFPDEVYNLSSEVNINAYLNQSGSTQGICEVIITYV